MKKLFVFFAGLFIPVFLVYAETCNTIATKMRAIYTPNSYTCNAGYFLPANTAGCRVCPSEASCDGGSFFFNPDVAQGIVYDTFKHNLTNTCSVDFSSKLRAVFVPNTINLNYDDGNGNTTAMTCDYGGTINIPETAPTRPGYVFTGWVVRQNEQSNE